MLRLYENIRKRRVELSITQEELAQKTGYSGKSMIAKIEKGLVDVPQSKIEAFADALGVSPAYLMGWTNDTPSPPPLTVPEQRLIGDYRQLNDTGKEEAGKRVHELTMIDAYKKDTGLSSGGEIA